MNEFDFEIIPLFSRPVSVIKVHEDLSLIKENFKTEKFTETASSYEFYHSKNLKILDNFPEQKNIILNYFNRYKNDVLRLSTTDFKMTSSWVTKTEINGYSQFHTHANSIYSGIFYFDECSSVGGNLEFITYDNGVIELNEPTEKNIWNTSSFTIQPEKNMLVIFPSNVIHRVTQYNSNTPRYSLAFNLFPINKISNADSFLDIKLY